MNLIRKENFLFFAVAMVFCSLFFVQYASAQATEPIEKKEEAVETKEETKPKPTHESGNVMNLDATLVEGKIQKPEAFYLLEDAGLEHDETIPRKDFLIEIVQAIQVDPLTTSK